MDQRRSFAHYAAAVVLTFAAGGLARAAPPQGPWTPIDIGDTDLAGSTDLDATGVWTVKGSGELFNPGNPVSEDSFHFAYQKLRGDASITARFLSRTGGDGWTPMTGLMIRADDAPGAPYVNLTMVSGGLIDTARIEPGAPSGTTWQVGPDPQPTKGLILRLQRVGHEIAGFYSRDGKLWNQASFSPRLLPLLKEEALFGLATASNTPGKLTTGKFDQVEVQSGAELVYAVRACGMDHAVLLEWGSLPGAMGYNVYRSAADGTGAPHVKLNDAPIAGTTITDRDDSLVNGTPLSYEIVPVFQAGDGSTAEGPVVGLRATPVATPPGFLGCSINEGPRSGSVAVDAATGEITLRGAGSNVWFTGDQFYYLYRPVEGNVRITVKALTRPSASNDWAKAGLMLRDSLDGAARFAFLMVTPGNGLAFQWRTVPNKLADWPEAPEIDPGDLKLPITLRLTRRGSTITPEYSTDDGKIFVAGEPLTWEGAVPQTLYVGLAVTSTNLTEVASEKFSGLGVE